MNTFEEAFGFVVGQEGGFSSNPSDPGNWTGGRVDTGELLGTKFGISASAYPHLDIKNLTLPDAQNIYRRDYWDRVKADRLPPALAVLVFDAAVNCGVHRAACWLQQTVGVVVDGMVGPLTLEAIGRASPTGTGLGGVCASFLALRLVFMVSLPTWRQFGPGWSRRIFRLAYSSIMNDKN